MGTSSTRFAIAATIANAKPGDTHQFKFDFGMVPSLLDGSYTMQSKGANEMWTSYAAVMFVTLSTNNDVPMIDAVEIHGSARMGSNPSVYWYKDGKFLYQRPANRIRDVKEFSVFDEKELRTWTRKQGDNGLIYISADKQKKFSPTNFKFEATDQACPIIAVDGDAYDPRTRQQRYAQGLPELNAIFGTERRRVPDTDIARVRDLGYEIHNSNEIDVDQSPMSRDILDVVNEYRARTRKSLKTPPNALVLSL